MNHTVNLAIQVLPVGVSKDETYRIVDEAIQCIQHSGIRYVVCPFETVVEGEYDKVMQLLTDIQEGCARAGAPEVIINMKLQRNFSAGITIEDKMEKYS